MRGVNTLPSCAIVALVRGYPEDRSHYGDLIARNRAIYQEVNSKRTQPVPLRLFHEGNISPEDQEFVRSHTPEQTIDFVDVSTVWLRDAEYYQGLPSVGYRLMCRFNTVHIWEYCADLDYFMRVDEDVILTGTDPHFEDRMAEEGLDFAFSIYFLDSHEGTNATLYPFAQLGFGGSRRIDNDRMVPYTNVYAARTAFWNAPRVRTTLRSLGLNPLQMKYRWGDAALLGLAAEVHEAKLAPLPGLEYRHLSHDGIAIRALENRVDVRGVNIATAAQCSQSSLSPWSVGPNEADRAVRGMRTGAFSFHTDNDDSPWLQLDFGEPRNFDEVLCFNRLDACSERAIGLVVEISVDGSSWVAIGGADRVFGGSRDGDPLRIVFPRSCSRYIRFRLPSRGCLHLDKVEVYDWEAPSPSDLSRDSRLLVLLQQQLALTIESKSRRV
jgi:hypothetical protein